MGWRLNTILSWTAWLAQQQTIFNTITSNINTPRYYIVWWTGNVYNLQDNYKFHALDHPVIIPEGELFCPAECMTPMRKTSYWYHDRNEKIPVMVKLNKLWCLTFNWFRTTTKTNKLPSRFKGYVDTNPHLLSEHDHQIVLDKIEGIENINKDEYVEDENCYNVDSDDSNYDDN